MAGAAQAITLSNNGPGALSIDGIGITGTNPGDFAQTNNCPVSLAINGFCTIDVTFTPQAANLRSAAVTITDNGAGSPQSVGLSGTGWSSNMAQRVHLSSHFHRCRRPGAERTDQFPRLDFGHLRRLRDHGQRRQDFQYLHADSGQ